MKHLVASLTIGTCLLLLPSGLVLAGNLHTTNPSMVGGTGKGQTGSNHGNSCTPGVGPGGAASAGGSAFNPSGTAGMNYAGNGANTNTPANAAAVAQYDVACFQAP
jgi:hypothetical protein